MEQLHLLSSLSSGSSGMSCKPNSCYKACVLSCGTMAGSGDTMANEEKSSALGSSGGTRVLFFPTSFFFLQ